MNQHFNVNSISEAWQKVAEVFPSDYVRDDSSSARAGYDIYRSTVKSEGGNYQWYYCYICNLGCTLEVNLTDDKWNATTIYINIEKAAEAEEPAQETETETETETPGNVRTCIDRRRSKIDPRCRLPCIHEKHGEIYRRQTQTRRNHDGIL